jgi:transposase, IS5 family
MKGQLGFFDLADRYAQLSKSGDPLEHLSATVDFEPFRYRLMKALKRSDGSKGGRPPYNPVLMFKILILQALYGLSDEQAEFQIRDRLSFMRFVDLGLHDPVPDATTMWLFREHLTRAGAVKTLFERFDALLREKGYIAMSGQILDASLIPAPRQHVNDDEKQAIKDGASADDIWPDQPAKAAQQDVDARWTLKVSKAKPNAEGRSAPVDIAIPVFGYENHIGIDRRYGLIRTWLVTDAAAHDGARLARRLDRQGEHRLRRLGRHRLPIPGEQRVPVRDRQGEPYPPQKAKGQAHGRPHRQGQCGWCAQTSNTSLPGSSTGWGCSSGPSVWIGPRPRSGWPISPTICAG